MSSRGKRDEDIELASTRDFRRSTGRGVEVEGTGLALGLRRKVESKEGSNVGLIAIFKDLTFSLVAAYSAGLNVVLGGNV